MDIKLYDTNREQERVSSYYIPYQNSKVDALNLVENLLVFDEIGIEEYEALRTVLGMLNKDNNVVLGEGICIALVDRQTS